MRRLAEDFRARLASLLLPLTLACGISLAGSADAQDFERWFQVEVTVFSNEPVADRERESWPAAAPPQVWPENMVELRQVSDLLLPESSAPEPEPEPDSETLPPELAPWRDTGPFPAEAGTGLRLPDLERDAFLALPASLSDFRQTNRALSQAPQYRVLFSGLWRQPVGDFAAPLRPVHIAGGERVAGRTELQGMMSLRFNANRDRVLCDVELWLIETDAASSRRQSMQARSRQQSMQQEPVQQEPVQQEPRRVYKMQQRRELRSGEFHYLDHPALGVIVQITRYDVPPPLEPPGEQD